MTANTWEPFGIPQEAWEDAPEHGGVKWLHLSPRRPHSDRAPGSVLINIAALLLGLLAAGLFVVSLAAQYRYIYAEKHQVAPAIIEAVGLDVGMAIFSLLALGLAMAGQSARTERALIIVCAAGSAAMNYAAANDGSPRSVAAYVVPPVFLAIVDDRVIAVVRRHVVGETERSAWAGFGRGALYALRFVIAMPSTASGLRRQVLDMTPLPGASAPALPPVAAEPDEASGQWDYPEPCAECPPVVKDEAGNCVNCGTGAEEQAHPSPHRTQSKTARFLELVSERHGELAGIDPAHVGRIARELAPEADLDTGSARAALRPRILAAQNGHAS